MLKKSDLRNFGGAYTCPDCGYCFVPNEPRDWECHEEVHAYRMLAQQPILMHPSDIKTGFMSQALIWPTIGDAERLTKLLRQYAISFKREMKTDFLAWDDSYLKEDDSLPFFVRDLNYLIGAGSFTWFPCLATWELEWIWICPGERRKGNLRKIWTQFSADKNELNSFKVSQPVSKSMKKFLLSIDWPK